MNNTKSVFDLDTMDPNAMLERLNHEKVIHLLPVIVTVIIIMILGITGNSIVCYVYYFKMRKTPSHYFVLFLSVLDLVSCCIGMPTELVDLFLPYTFTKPFACKFLRFVLSFTVISSCITLICVAFDRYYKVCRPLKSFPIRKVQFLCGVAVFIGIILSWPALVIFGTRTVETSLPGFYGKECSTADSIKNTKYPFAYYVTLFSAYVITFLIFAVLYAKIGIEIHKRKNNSISDKLPQSMKEVLKRKEFTTSMLSDEESTSAVSEEEHKLRPNRTSLSHLRDYIVQQFRPEIESDLKSSNSETNGTKSVALASKRKKLLYRNIRTTYIFLAVFLAFLVSFLPYLIVKVLQVTKYAFHDMDTVAEDVIYNFCVRSYFISNFINPIIYSLLNKNFRKECKALFKKCVKMHNRDSMISC